MKPAKGAKTIAWPTLLPKRPGRGGLESTRRIIGNEQSA